MYAEKTWKLLESAIHEINNDNSSGLSFEELHRCVLCFMDWLDGAMLCCVVLTVLLIVFVMTSVYFIVDGVF